MEVLWEHHSSELVQSLASFLKEGVLQDVTLVASEGKRIRAHRVILAASSEYFKVGILRYLYSYKDFQKFYDKHYIRLHLFLGSTRINR